MRTESLSWIIISVHHMLIERVKVASFDSWRAPLPQWLVSFGRRPVCEGQKKLPGLSELCYIQYTTSLNIIYNLLRSTSHQGWWYHVHCAVISVRNTYALKMSTQHLNIEQWRCCTFIRSISILSPFRDPSSSACVVSSLLLSFPLVAPQ